MRQEIGVVGLVPEPDKRAWVKQKIVSNEEVAPGVFRMSVEGWKEIQSASPGQFLHIRCSTTFEPLLRRPFSIHDVDSNEVRILYKVIGCGTKLLSEKKPGDKLDVVGPLGHGFSIEPPSESVVIVAGGIGVAPMLFLARLIKARRKQVLIGARTRGLILYEEEFRRPGCSVEVTTDDGSYGKKGQVSALLREFLRGQKPAIVYACGPVGLLKEIANTCSSYNTLCQVSLENRMGCGVGACLGCVIRTKEKDGSTIYRRVCREGPVFDAGTVSWGSLI